MFSASVRRTAPWWVLAFLVLAFVSGSASAECTNGASYGSATIDSTGAVTTISICSWPGEYSTIYGASTRQSLRFATSVATDYITIRSGTHNGALVAYGQTPLTFTNTFSGDLFAHWSSDAACGVSNSSCRLTTVQFLGCVNASAFGSATINPNGSVVTISTCSFPGEYSTISGAVSGQTLRFTSSFAGEFITIRTGSIDGPMIAAGTTPLTFANTHTGTLYAHWSKDAGCATEGSFCRITTVQVLLDLIFRNGFE